MKQQSELSRYLADPKWIEKEAELREKFLDVFGGVPDIFYGKTKPPAPSTPPMESGKKEKV